MRGFSLRNLHDLRVALDKVARAVSALDSGTVDQVFQARQLRIAVGMIETVLREAFPLPADEGSIQWPT